MKKLTAIILSVIMLVTAFPLTSFATGETVIMIDDAKDFAKMTDGRSYILTKNIELGSEWQTIQSFSGTLDGNGYTVTVPTNAPIFEVISGTVKNLNLTGEMALGDEDVSKHYIGVYNIHYAVGVLANRAMGATIDNVHSDVNVSFAQTNGNSRVVFGGMIGVAYPSYKLDWLKYTIEDVRKTAINNCTVAGSITAKYKKSESNKVDSVSGLVALITCSVNISNVAVTADIDVTNGSGYVAGIVAVQYTESLPTLEGEVVNPPDFTNKEQTLETPTITNCLVSGKISHTYTDTSNRGKTSGVIGHAQGVRIKACAYDGGTYEESPLTDAGGIFSILAYAQPAATWCHMSVDSCVTTLEKVRMIVIDKPKGAIDVSKTTTVDNAITWGTAPASKGYITNLSNNATQQPKPYASMEVALQTFANDNAPTFSYINGKLKLNTVTPPSPGYSHNISVSTEVDGKLSTGMCTNTDDNCNYVTGDPYAGFVQFNNDGTRLRVIMIVSEEELGDSVNKKLKSLNLRVTIENQSIEISGTEFTAYELVTAAGQKYVASEGYYLFGVVFNFEVDMSSTAPSVAIIYEGETEPVFEGSVKKPNA